MDTCFSSASTRFSVLFGIGGSPLSAGSSSSPRDRELSAKEQPTAPASARSDAEIDDADLADDYGAGSLAERLRKIADELTQKSDRLDGLASRLHDLETDIDGDSRVH